MTVYSGKDSFLQLLESVRSGSRQRIFFVTGKKSFDDSPARKIIFSLFQNKQICFFSNFSSNVKFEEALDGCYKFHASGADIIIAVGGGSVIDMAKIISVGLPEETSLLNIIDGRGTVKTKAKLYCAPTTAGSGSEATHFATIYVNGQKKSLAHKALLPDSIAIDPSLSASMPPYLTAYSGFDALSQAIEAYWAKSATSASREFSKQAIALILPNIHNAVHCPTLKIRALMAEGSYLAGRAINISKTTAPHALSYYLTAKFSIPHGHAVALLLGHFFQINEEKTPKELYSMLGMASASDCCVFWYEMMKKCFLETSLIRLGVVPSNVDEMVLSVNEERLSNNPVLLSKTDLINIINKLF
jgi:alcohol dehydrogenase class IV